MEEEMREIIRKNELSPFHSTKKQLPGNKSIFKTRDAKSIFTRTLNVFTSNFSFAQTPNLFHAFPFTDEPGEIIRRQQFFKEQGSVPTRTAWLKELYLPRPHWKPDYEVIVVTENTELYTELKEKGCPTKLLLSETDVALLESADIVQIIDCPEFSRVLESLPQAIFLRHPSEAYLERYVEELSGWEHNNELIKANETTVQIQEIIGKLEPLRNIIRGERKEVLDRDTLDERVIAINDHMNGRLKDLTITGDALVQMVAKGVIPEELKSVAKEAIGESGIPMHLMVVGIPVRLDEEETEKYLQKMQAETFSSQAERINASAEHIKEIPKLLSELKEELLLFDFLSGCARYMNDEMKFPEIAGDFSLFQGKNAFLDRAQPVTFYLNQEERCSILTGANSGGKTTLIEHILQVITLTQMGLPVSGSIKSPLFTEIYYFAKNKGSLQKGAFETLLAQMATIRPGGKTLILADEIEAVTEPGVAGEIIAGTAEYFLNQGCFLVVATHLGHEIQHMLPQNARIDGIEAKGLTKDFELIVDHNPVLGRLAHSTPELIVEKMANTEKKPYFEFLHQKLQSKE